MNSAPRTTIVSGAAEGEELAAPSPSRPTLTLCESGDAPLDVYDTATSTHRDVCEQPRRETLTRDAFGSSPSPSRATRADGSVDGMNLSECDTEGFPSTSSRLASASPAAPLELVERYLHFLASGDAFAASLSQRTSSQAAIATSTDAITEKASYLALSGSRSSVSSTTPSRAAARPSTSSSSSPGGDTARTDANAEAAVAAPYLVEPVFIQASTVKLLLRRLSDDIVTLQDAHRQQVAMKVLDDSSPSLSPKTVGATALDVSMSTPLHMPCHAAIPLKLDLPLKERCPFCQKHDSMCSCCHAKWSAIQRDIRENKIQPAYTALPAAKRMSLAFLSAAFGDGDLLSAQVFHDPFLVGQAQIHYHTISVGETWRATLAGVAPKPKPIVVDYDLDLFVGDSNHDAQTRGGDDALTGATLTQAKESVLLWLQSTLRDAGAVHTLHVALAHRNTATTRALLTDPDVHFLASESSVDPLSCLQCGLHAVAAAPLPPSLVRVLNASLECRQHIRSELAKASLKERRYDDAKPLLEALLRENPEDERGLWLSAVLDYGEKRFAASQKRLQHILRTSSTQPLVFLDKGQIHRLLVDVANALQVSRRHPQLEDRHVLLPIRRLPFSVVRDALLPFCEPITLLRVYQASPMPLLRATAEAIAATAPARLLHPVLTDDSAHYGELVLDMIHELPAMEPVTTAQKMPSSEALRSSREELDGGVCPPSQAPPLAPSASESKATAPPPPAPQALVADGTLRPRSVHVLSMTDFCNVVVKVSMAGKRSRAFTASLRARSSPTSLFDQLVGPLDPVTTYLNANEIVLSRVFTVRRQAVGAAWSATAYTPWELDLLATDQLSSS